MTVRATLEAMKLTGKVKNGAVAVDLPEGTPVSIEVVPTEYVIDANGFIVLTEEESERELRLAELEADRGEGIPWRVAMAQIRGYADAHAKPRKRARR